MPDEFLRTQTVGHAIRRDGSQYVVAFWTSLDSNSTEPLGIIAGDLESNSWKQISVVPADGDRSPISSIDRSGGLLFVNLSYSLDDDAIVVIAPALVYRGTIYGSVREVWPNGLVYYDSHQPHFGPHRTEFAVFNPTSGVARQLYPPEQCQPVRCDYSTRLKEAGGGPVPFIQASEVSERVLNWPQRALAFVALYQQEYDLVTPPGWTEEQTVMVVCDGLGEAETSRCEETPIDAWRRAFPGVPDLELPARAAAEPRRIRP